MRNQYACCLIFYYYPPCFEYHCLFNLKRNPYFTGVILNLICQPRRKMRGKIIEDENYLFVPQRKYSCGLLGIIFQVFYSTLVLFSSSLLLFFPFVFTVFSHFIIIIFLFYFSKFSYVGLLEFYRCNANKRTYISQFFELH